MCGKQTLSLLILGKSRMRKRARTDLCGGRSAMVVPTATTGPGPITSGLSVIQPQSAAVAIYITPSLAPQ